jgi:nicotinamidase-related amidase
MPLTNLDSNAALVVIDLQKGIVGIPAAHPVSEIVDRSAQLARAFRQRGLPVVLVNVVSGPPGRSDAGRPKYVLPDDWAELVPELEQQPSDLFVSKRSWGAFLTTSLHEILHERGVTQIFLTGISTSAGVESTARSAYDLGYNVVLVVDAITDRNSEIHQHCVETIFPRLGETETTANILKMLNEVASLSSIS